jgi:hypothetical protein
VKLEKTASDTCTLLSEDYRGEGVKKPSVLVAKRFKDNPENVKDDERSGRPRSHRTGENVGKVQNLVH